VTIYQSRDYKDGHPIRVMSLDNKLDSAMFLDSDELVFDYTKYYRLAYAYNQNLKKILVIGGAGYSVPKDFLKRGVQVDVVELDPELTKLAQKYFDPSHQLQSNNYNLKIFHEDGRTFLNRIKGEQYDAIMVDAFRSYSIPYQLTTIQSVNDMKSLLKPNGVVLANVISAVEGDKGQFLQSEYATFNQVFPVVDLYPVTSSEVGQAVQNLMLVGSLSPAVTSTNQEIAKYQQNIWTKKIEPGPVLTDDYAPVDQMMLATML
jgi:spermidine synthase